MKVGKTILVSRPCFGINKFTGEVIKGENLDKDDIALACQSFGGGLPIPQEDEILYKYDENRGTIYNFSSKPYKRTPSEKIQNITDSLNRLLQAKNKNYGSSALSPLGIFNKNEATEGIKVRLDDKLMRVKNSSELRKNDIADIMGYLVLLCVSEEWLDFDELID